MNCKPGDLAVIVSISNPADRPHLGKIVTCIRHRMDEYGGGWVTSPELTILKGPCRGFSLIWHDDDLRPIRDQDGEDETLAWAGKPSEVTA